MPVTLFSAANINGNDELWRTDGTFAGTSLLMDIRPGGTGSIPSNPIPGGAGSFAALGGFVYFTADDGVHGSELWRSDGNNTTMVTDFLGSIGGIPNGYAPQNIVVANGLLFFQGNGPSGPGIYKSDGTNAGTAFISATSGLVGYAASSTNLYWSQDTGLSDSGLYTTNGGAASHIDTSANSTGLVSAGNAVYWSTSFSLSKVVGSTVTDISGAPNGTKNHTAVGGTEYFLDGGGTTLYSTTGTSTTTVRTGLDFNTAPPFFAALGSNLIFTNTNAANGTELWISNGTNAGTHILKDLVTGTTAGQPNSGNPKFLTKVGSNVFFQASDGNLGIDLWKTDGTTPGTVLVKHIETARLAPSGPSQAPDLTNMTAANGMLFFGADDGANGTEMWRSDGTQAGTFQVKPINKTVLDTSFDGTLSTQGVSIGGTTYFTGFDINHGYELWSSNNTAAGTQLMLDIYPGLFNSNASTLTLVGSKFFFSADNGTNGKELWVSDGTAAGTHITKDINPGKAGGIPTFFNSQFITPLGSKVVFTADDGTTGQELWASDGTFGGTIPLGDLNPGSAGGIPNSSTPASFTVVGSKAFFTATTNANGAELFVTDGTAGAGHTFMVKDINPLAGTGSGIQNPTVFGSQLAFIADDGTHGNEVWISDGSTIPGNTFLLKDINNVGSTSSNPGSLVVANGKLLFFADDGGANGRQLWSSNGTLNNATVLSANPNFQPNGMVSIGTLAFFSGFTAASGQELYVSNGTGAPTQININPTAGQGSNPSLLTVLGSKVLFTAADTTAHGAELWVSDGTAGAGHTFMIQDINLTASQGSNPNNFTVVGSKAFFTADDGINGTELWITDGIAGGAGHTFMVKNINTVAAGGGLNQASNPSLLKAIDSTHVMFLANDGVHGSEEWISDGTDAGTVRVTDVVQGQGANPSGYASVPFTLPVVKLPIDFNADGKSDLVWQNNDGTVAVWTMNGVTPITGVIVSLNPGSSWHLKESLDFTADGKPDLLWQNNDGTPAIWTMNGTTPTSGSALPNPGSAWHLITAKDFTSDGKPDLLWQNDDGTPAIWTMNGITPVTGTSLTNPGASWKLINAADFTGDGKPDLLWQNADGTAAIWTMNGVTPVNGTVISLNPGAAWHLKEAVDFTDDGTPDLLWQNDDGTPAIWTMNGVTPILGTVFSPNPGPAWHIKDAADFTGDGRPDLVWQHDDGTAAIWTMDGVTPTLGTTLTNPGAAWHLIA